MASRGVCRDAPDGGQVSGQLHGGSDDESQLELEVQVFRDVH